MSTVYAKQKQEAHKVIEYLDIGGESLPVFSSYYILDNEVYFDLDETQYKIVYIARNHKDEWETLNNVQARQLKAISKGLIADIKKRVDPDDIVIDPEYLPVETIYRIDWGRTVLAATIFSLLSSVVGSGLLFLLMKG